jgi:hypothetical protein
MMELTAGNERSCDARAETTSNTAHAGTACSDGTAATSSVTSVHAPLASASLLPASAGAAALEPRKGDGGAVRAYC